MRLSLPSANCCCDVLQQPGYRRAVTSQPAGQGRLCLCIGCRRGDSLSETRFISKGCTVKRIPEALLGLFHVSQDARARILLRTV